MNSQVVQLMDARYSWQPSSNTTTMEKIPTRTRLARRKPLLLNHKSQVTLGDNPDLPEKCFIVSELVLENQMFLS